AREVPMTVKSTATRYGSVAIAIHWASAIAIVATIVMGWIASDAEAASAVTLLRGHILLGSLVLILTLLRIGWWVFADKRPAPVSGLPAWQRFASGLVHTAIYAVILLMASSGIATVVISGALPALLAGTLLPDFS